jgi:hypothetical protein
MLTLGEAATPPWSDPKPLPTTLLSVKPFNLASIGPPVEDRWGLLSTAISASAQARIEWVEAGESQERRHRPPWMHEISRDERGDEAGCSGLRSRLGKPMGGRENLPNRNEAVQAAAKKCADKGEDVVLQNIEGPEEPQDRRSVATEVSIRHQAKSPPTEPWRSVTS